MHFSYWLQLGRSFSSTCIHSQNKDDSLVVFASAAIAALISEQMCILLLVRFLVKRSSAHLRTAITSAENTVERLPIGMLSL
jgi:hypothetical protein